MRVFRHVNKIFESNTYILSRDDKDGAYVVDPGDSLHIFNWLKSHEKNLLGILLTHAHFDHMYGLNDILEAFPKISLYVSSLMVEGLFSVKLNTSLYHEKPYVLNEKFSKNITIIEKDELLIWENIKVCFMKTPGHTEDSISLYIDKCLFSGDALIPGIKVYYRKKTGNLDNITSSINKLYTTVPLCTKLLPGHGKDYIFGQAKSTENFSRLEYINDFIEI